MRAVEARKSNSSSVASRLCLGNISNPLARPAEAAVAVVRAAANNQTLNPNS